MGNQVFLTQEQQFGLWTIISSERKIFKRGNTGRSDTAYYKCKCKCDKEQWIQASRLKLGQTLGCKRCRVRLALAKRIGENNPGWKGGRIIDKKGYALLRSDDHPRRRNKGHSLRGGYVFEHILVMEAKIGRFLNKDETVHHLNGIRNDNRPENLELWSKSHPPGQRVIDKIVWAKEILKLYDNTLFSTDALA